MTIISICPGCSIGCGLYIREANDGSGIRVDFRKRSPVNMGKICGFGTRIKSFYEDSPIKPMIKGKEAPQDEAIGEAAKLLKAAGKNAAILCMGNATNEEIMALNELAAAIGVDAVETGLGELLKAVPEDMHPIVKVGIPLEEIENASNIVLVDTDVLVQYPLVARRIIAARKKGAKVLEIGVSPSTLADTGITISPGELVKGIQDAVGSSEVKKMLDDKAVVICDTSPLTDVEIVKAAINMCADTGAKPLFLHPYANPTGLMLLGTPSTGGISGLVDRINKGEVKALFVLESDPAACMPNAGEIKEALEKLDALIVQTARETPITALADVVIENDAFYMKDGSTVNIEGRVQKNHGTSTFGFDALTKLSKAAGGKELKAEDAFKHAMGKLGVEGEIDEDVIPVSRGEVKLSKITPGEAKATAGEVFLVYRTNPLTWNAVPGDCVVEAGYSLLVGLSMYKDEQLSIKSSAGESAVDFKPSRDLQDKVLVSKTLLSAGNGAVTGVEVSKRSSSLSIPE